MLLRHQHKFCHVQGALQGTLAKHHTSMTSLTSNIHCVLLIQWFEEVPFPSTESSFRQPL
jgi:hypothetical protein